MSFFDLIWIGLILYAVLNGLGKKKRSALPPGESPDGAEASPRPGIAQEFRRKLVEAAKEWEDDQRRQRGEPPLAGPAPREAVARPAPGETVARPEPHPRSEPSIRRVRDVTPDRIPDRRPDDVRVASSVRTPEPRASAPPLVAKERRPGRPRSEGAAGARRPARTVESGIPAEKTRGRHRGGPGSLAALSRYPTLQRAILFGEILGRPKALEESPDPRLDG